MSLIKFDSKSIWISLEFNCDLIENVLIVKIIIMYLIEFGLIKWDSKGLWTESKIQLSKKWQNFESQLISKIKKTLYVSFIKLIGDWKSICIEISSNLLRKYHRLHFWSHNHLLPPPYIHQKSLPTKVNPLASFFKKINIWNSFSSFTKFTLHCLSSLCEKKGRISRALKIFFCFCTHTAELEKRRVRKETEIMNEMFSVHYRSKVLKCYEIWRWNKNEASK